MAFWWRRTGRGHVYLDCLILTVGALGVLLAHELGHFMMARSFGFNVAALSLGLGPEILGHTDRSGTRWKIGALPIGGSCVLSDAANRRSLSTASLAQRAMIYAAGPLLNLLLAAIDFGAIDFQGGGSAFVSLDMRLAVLIGAFSVSIGLFNLLPILPLDGGRLLLIAFEAVRGRRVGKREEKRLLLIGLSVLASTTIAAVFFLFKAIG